MFNTKVIVLSGFARGGTNIAWNILQSHPDVCSPIYETGELFSRSWKLRFCRPLARRIDVCKKVIDAQLIESKLETLEHADNKFIKEGKLYTVEQVTNATLNLKSVNNDIFLTNLLLKVYPNLYFIALARNGYALCDGYIRRGLTATDAGRLYQRIGQEMQRYSNTISRFKIIRFEDILQHPFEKAEELYAFSELSPVKLEKLRLKSKKVINKAGDHKSAFGNENRKYWFDRGSIGQILDPNVNQTQVGRLTEKHIREFNREAGSALEFFGYEKY